MKKDIFESSQDEFDNLDIKIVIGVAIGFGVGFIFHEKFISTVNWYAVQAIALIITAIFIAQQAYYTRKNIEVSAMPSIYFGLRSQKLKDLENEYKEKILLVKGQPRKEKKLKKEMERKKRAINKLSIKEKIKTYFIVINNSKYPILFNVKINYEIDGKPIAHSDDGYWEEKGKEPLHIFPPGMRYPDVVNLKNVSDLRNLVGNSESITAHIEYKYTPRFASEIIKYGPFQESWTYYLKESRWRGPQSVKEENLNI